MHSLLRSRSLGPHFRWGHPWCFSESLFCWHLEVPWLGSWWFPLSKMDERGVPLDFLPLIVRTVSGDTPFFHTDSLRQAADILWLTVAVVVILCPRVLLVATQRRLSLLVLDPSHILVATLHRGLISVSVLGVVGSIGLGRWGLGELEFHI